MINMSMVEIRRSYKYGGDNAFTISIKDTVGTIGPYLNFVLDWPKTLEEIVGYLVDNFGRSHFSILYNAHPNETVDVFGSNIKSWNKSSAVSGLYTREVDVASFNKQRNLTMLKDMRARKNNVKMFNWDEKELAYPIQHYIQIENISGEELYIVYSDDMLPEEFSSVEDAVLWLSKKYDAGTKLQLTHVTSDIREIFTNENIAGMVDITSDNSECLNFKCGEIVYG